MKIVLTKEEIASAVRTYIHTKYGMNSGHVNFMIFPNNIEAHATCNSTDHSNGHPLGDPMNDPPSLR